MTGDSGLFDLGDVSSDNLCYNLALLADKKRRIIKFLSKRLGEPGQRKVCLALYDAADFFFEPFEEKSTAETRAVTGLLIDEDGIPVDYELFPGNTCEMRTILTAVNNFLSSCGLEKIAIVSDCDLNSAADVMALHVQGSNFISACSLKTLKESKLDEVLNATLDQWHFPDRDSAEDLAKQRRLFETDLLVTTDEDDGAGSGLRIRMVVNFSYERYLEDCRDIDECEYKAKCLLRQGASAIDEIKAGKVEYIQAGALDAKGIQKDRQIAGYRAFITNIPKEESDAPSLSGQLESLRKIKDDFRITDIALNGRPVRELKSSGFESCLMMCFLSLVIEQLCLKKIRAEVDSAFTAANLKEFLHEITYARILGAKRSTAVYQKVAVTSDENVALHDKIYRCFGIEELNSLESAQNLSRKLGVTLRFSPGLVPQAQPKAVTR